LAITDNNGKEYWDKYKNNTVCWTDHLGTGYYIPNKKENKLNFEKNFPQYSRREDTEEETSGNWVSLTIDHGKAPKGQSYEYMVLPQTDNKTMERIAKKTPYKVLQKDRNAHIVKDIETNITSYVLFETPHTLPKGLVQKADTSCLIMVKENKKNATLTVCNPDLALYRGPADEIFDKAGKRIERSIYSRPWKFNESEEIPVTVTLTGEWKMRETENCKIVKTNKKETVLLFSCKDGASINVELSK
jgi:chondroitin-sulfate-ABC endolyase/exolyase